MKHKRIKSLYTFALLGCLLSLAVVSHAAEPVGAQSRVMLEQNWKIQSACEAKAGGEEISTSGFSTVGWYSATVPTTVVAALVADKTYPDPFVGKNLQSFPGMDYDKSSFFANQSMPQDSPFRCAWWFRTEFDGPAANSKLKTWLHFDALNYRANIWLNGKKLASAEDVAGTYRIFEFEVSQHLVSHRNALAVEIVAPDKNDLGMTWVDWNPTPADKDMGLWKDVYLISSGDVSVRHSFVTSKLSADYKTAALTVYADVQNATDHAVSCSVQVAIEGIRLSQKIDLAPAELKTISFTPDNFPRLKFEHPRLWWPYQMGSPEVYTAELTVESNGRVSDSQEVTFGIREITSQFTEKGGRLFLVNGRKILIRGAAWAPDMLLRWSPEQAAAALNYTRHMGLNTVRLEGRMERDEFFEMADRLGILIMPGWTCCDMWERWSEWTPETTKIAAASLSDQILRLRTHPSVFVWLYGSDGPPPADVENMYLQILKDKQWPNPSVSSASEQTTTVTGASGVKMTGPYDYVPPNYWLTDTQAGGAYGFNTETGPGPAIPPLESLKRFIPADQLWPIDDYWNYHAGGERFTTLDRFLTGMNQRYGKAENLNDFLRKSQAMNYEGQRAMFEAYARNKYTSTGVIQWMLNNAWPSLIWHLYDYYLVPAGGYFGTKKACEPLHVQYSYDDNSVAVINGYDHAIDKLKVTAKIYSFDGKEKAAPEIGLNVPADSSVRALELPNVEGISSTYFLKLELRDDHNKLLSDNFYWLSTKPDVLDWAKRDDTIYTPQSAYADLSGLNQLPAAKLSVKTKLSGQDSELYQNMVLHVTVKNPGTQLAFMVHLRVANASGTEDVAPILWDENYFSLLPGETRDVTAQFHTPSSPRASLVIDGWNVNPVQVDLTIH